VPDCDRTAARIMMMARPAAGAGRLVLIPGRPSGPGGRGEQAAASAQVACEFRRVISADSESANLNETDIRLRL
jgi:hypothetical protein